jgi:hypothetical protein
LSDLCSWLDRAACQNGERDENNGRFGQIDKTTDIQSAKHLQKSPPGALHDERPQRLIDRISWGHCFPCVRNLALIKGGGKKKKNFFAADKVSTNLSRCGGWHFFLLCFFFFFPQMVHPLKSFLNEKWPGAAQSST